VIDLLVMVLSVLLQTSAPAFRTLDKGVVSGIATGRQVAALDRDAWSAIWRQHAAERAQPEVDFSREMVVGVFLGTRPTAGFGVEILRYREMGNDVVVVYREAAPPRDAITAQMLTSPFHIVAIPKRTGQVTFEKAN
jgi:hypothetical protein